MLLWRKVWPKVIHSSSFCPFPFKFLSVNKTFDMHLSNGLKSSGGGWIFSNQVTKVTLEINWPSEEAAFWRFLALFFDFSVWECYLKDLQRSWKQSSQLLWVIFLVLPTVIFSMKLMVPGNGVLVEGGGKIEADWCDFEPALYLMPCPEDQGGDMLAESRAEDSRELENS